MEEFLNREIKTVIKNQKSEWCSLKSGVPQESILVPMMLLIYVIDITEGVNIYINLFAANAKL